jgi:hypothetical protein
MLEGSGAVKCGGWHRRNDWDGWSSRRGERCGGREIRVDGCDNLLCDE